MCRIYTGARSVLASIDATSEDTERIVQLATLVGPKLGLDTQTEEFHGLIKDPVRLLTVHHFYE